MVKSNLTSNLNKFWVTVALGIVWACSHHSGKSPNGVLELRAFLDSGRVHTLEELSDFYENEVGLFGEPAFFLITSAEMVLQDPPQSYDATGKPLLSKRNPYYQVFVDVDPDGLSENGYITFGDFTQKAIGHQVVAVANGEVLNTFVINARLPPTIILRPPLGILASEWDAEFLVQKLLEPPDN